MGIYPCSVIKIIPSGTKFICAFLYLFKLASLSPPIPKTPEIIKNITTSFTLYSESMAKEMKNITNNIPPINAITSPNRLSLLLSTICMSYVIPSKCWLTVLYMICGGLERLNRSEAILRQRDAGSPPEPTAKDGRAIQRAIGAALVVFIRLKVM